jgi:hypothetical protein
MDSPQPKQSFTLVDIKANDVLFGRGPFCYRFPGNVAFRNLIRSHVATYSRCAPRTLKENIVKKLISKAQKQGCRFFVRNQCSDIWYEAHPYLVRSKVSHALRDARNSVGNVCDSNSQNISWNDNRHEAKLNDKQGHRSFDIVPTSTP